MADSKEDITLDEEFQEKWREAIEQFAQSTKGNQINVRCQVTPESLSELFRGKQEPHSSDRWDGLAKLALKTGQITLKIGAIAASVGSLFFPPSDMAMNAINFFVGAAVKYNQIFKSLNLLFERISSSMERFSIYAENQDVLPSGVRKVAHEILLRLVSTCRVGHKVLKGNKVKLFVNAAFFDSNAGVQAELAALDELTRREALTNAAYTVVNAAKSVTIGNEIFQHQQQLEKQNEQDRDAKFLSNQLGKEPQFEEWRRQMARKGIPSEPGVWIKDNAIFHRWINTYQQPILLLSGVESTGKSMLMSRMVDTLQEESKGSRGICVAYFFPSGDGEKSNSDKSDVASKTQGRSKATLEIALRTMSLQVSERDPIYRKNLIQNLRAHLLQHPSLTNDVRELFKLLFIESTASLPVFLLFDDLHELSDLQTIMIFLECIDKQIREADQLRFRMLGTVRPDSKVYQKAQESHRQVLQIDLGVDNKDIVSYAQHRVEELQYPDDPTFQKLRAEIQDTLSGRQSFNEVDMILSAIRDQQRENDVRQVLTNFKTETGTRGGVINMLQRCSNLDEDNITDLNTLLEWILCDFPSYLGLWQLTDIVQFRNPSRAIKSLEKRMNEEFRDFFNIDEDGVQIATEAIKEYFEEFTSDTGYSERHAKALVTAAEVSIVEKMLKNMCGETLYEKLEFEAFFKEKAKVTFKVHVNVKEMNAKVALDCMRILKDSTLSVQFYIRSCWYKMVAKADPAQVNQDLKRDIGKSLVPLLCDHTGISSWSPEQWWAKDLIIGREVTQALLKWLEDSVVQEGVSEPQQKEWVKELSRSSMTPCEKVWRSVVQYMTRWWLLESPLGEFGINGTQYEAFRWIQGLLQETSASTLWKLDAENWYTSGGEWDSVEYIKPEYTEPEDVEEVITWAKKAIKIDQFSASTLCRLGDMHRCFRDYPQAIEQYTLAEQLDIQVHQATSGKASAQWQIDQKTEAIKTLQLAIEKQESQGSSDKEKIRKQQHTLATWHTSLKNYPEAFRIYETLLRINPDDYDTIRAVLDVHATVGNHQATKNFLDTLIAEGDKLYSDRMTGLIVHVTQASQSEQRFLPYRLLDVAKKVGYLELTNRKIHEAIAISKKNYDDKCAAKDGEDIAAADLYYLYSIGARWLYRHCLSDSEQSEALAYGIKAVELYKNMTGYTYFWGDQTATWLSHIYLSQAKEFPVNSVEERQIIDTIKGFCPEEHIHHTTERFLLQRRDVDYLIGFYYADRGQTALSMECLKGEVETGIELLTNESKDDDWIGYKRLALAFMRCNDMINATAAFSLIGPTNQSKVEQYALTRPETPTQVSLTSEQPVNTQSEEHRNPPEANDATGEPSNLKLSVENSSISRRLTRSHTTPQLTGPLTEVCDGRCGRSFLYASEIYWCKNCPDVQFDKGCLDKLMSGDLGIAVCDKAHEFFYIPPWSASKSKELGDLVEVDGVKMTIEQWLQGIRKTWGISTTNQKAAESSSNSTTSDKDDD